MSSFFTDCNQFSQSRSFKVQVLDKPKKCGILMTKGKAPNYKNIKHLRNNMKYPTPKVVVSPIIAAIADAVDHTSMTTEQLMFLALATVKGTEVDDDILGHLFHELGEAQ